MSKKYQEYKGLDLPGVGKSVLDYWEKNDIFGKSISESCFVLEGDSKVGTYKVYAIFVESAGTE